MVKKPVILAIESSCDETAAAIIVNGKIVDFKYDIENQTIINR